MIIAHFQGGPLDGHQQNCNLTLDRVQSVVEMPLHPCFLSSLTGEPIDLSMASLPVRQLSIYEVTNCITHSTELADVHYKFICFQPVRFRDQAYYRGFVDRIVKAHQAMSDG